jgi:hypothetical protein
VGSAIGPITIAEDSALDSLVSAGAFVDPDGDVLTLSASRGNGTPLPAWIAFDGRRFTGTPPANTSLTVPIRLTASDGEFTIAQTFDLVVAPVNDAPVVVDDGLFMVRGGNTLTILPAALLENDSDVEGDTLRIVSVANGTNGVARIAANGDILYTPDLNFIGEDRFLYTVTDGALTTGGWVTIKVSNPFEGWQQGGPGSDQLKGNMSSANDIFGGAGDDHIKGGKLNDRLAGGDGADHIQGMQGDDTLYGMAGNDKLNGGDGYDTAVFAGDRATYVLTTVGGELAIRDNDSVSNANEGLDTLVGIERLLFRGGETLSIASPIILDLDGDGSELLSAAESKARFDMDGDGKADDTSWFGAGDAMLFLDRDGNGTVSNAREFSFVQDAENARSDLEGLRAFDTNKDGTLSIADARFGEFRLWQDRNGDGVAAAAEISTLAAVNVVGIGLTGVATNVTANAGSAIAINNGTFVRSDGSKGTLADAALTFFSGNGVAKIDRASRSFERKGEKYQLISQAGQLFVTLRKAKGEIDPASALIAPATLMKFKDKTFGMLAPVILDLDGDGIELVKRGKSGARFDMDGDGSRDDTGWIGKGDGFLVIDRDNDGRITSATELSFLSEKPDARSDLDALSALDSNGDDKLDASDARFGELKVWVDRNRNGITEQGELKTLQELSIAAISLAGQAVERAGKIGDNMLVATSSFTLTDGTTRSLGDAALAYRPAGGTGGAASPAKTAPDDGLLEALRSGLDDGGSGLGLGLPEGIDPFEYFSAASGSGAAPRSEGATVGRQDLPDLMERIVDDVPTTAVSTTPEDLRLALMVQSMAGFGGSAGEGEAYGRASDQQRFDYFA